MELDDAMRAALVQAAEGEGVSVADLLERLVLSAARNRLMGDIAAIDSVAAAARIERRKTARVLPFRGAKKAAVRA